MYKISKRAVGGLAVPVVLNFSTSRYDEPSAKLAWERTMSFLKSKLV